MKKLIAVGIIASLVSFTSLASVNHQKVEDLEVYQSIQKSEKILEGRDKKQDYVQIKFGGWSHHKLDDRPEHFDYNENHKGFGIAWYNQLDDPILFGAINVVTIEAWYMKDSYRENQFQASLGLYHRFNFGLPLLEAVDIGINGGFMRRGFGTIDKHSGELVKLRTTGYHYILPGVSWHLHERFALDFTHVPKIPNMNLFPVTFVRGSFSFKS